MRLRNRLFITWGIVVLLLWAMAFWPIQWALNAGFARTVADGFAGTRHGLQSLQDERQARMRQAGSLIINIPELRALIAEHNYELSAENRQSLEERLDNLAAMVGVSFVCVFDARGEVVAQNSTSPWATIPNLRDFIHRSPQAAALVRGLFESRSSMVTEARSTSSLWSYRAHLYQVVGVPLVFTADEAPEVEGALVLASPMTDGLAMQLGRSHHCQVSFFADGNVVASSLAPEQRQNLAAALAPRKHGSTDNFDMHLGATAYRASIEDLTDPASGVAVGQMLVQSSAQDALAAQTTVSRVLALTMAGGLAAAALASFIISGAVARPLRQLVAGVRQVGAGDLGLTIASDRRDEFGELALAFNDMVRQLQARRELERQVAESQAMSQAKSQLLANMSHEIRTPIHGVTGMVELLLRTELDARQQRYAQLVKSSAEVLTALVNDLLDMSKIEAGKMELESVEFDLPDIVGDVVELLALKALAKNLEIACQIRPKVPRHVCGDPTRLRQILVNLVSNAVKFTESGRVIIRVLLDGPVGAPGIVRFSVTDTGIGIPPERIDRLFKSFSQVDASTTRRFGGTGLGLAISKQLVELMGGQIGVESQAGQGSTFWFTCALAEAPSQPQPPVPAQFHEVPVLVVDDQETSRTIACDQLATWGMRPIGVANDPQAWRQVDTVLQLQSPFRLLLVEKAMFDEHQSEFVRALRSRPKPERPTILLMLPLGSELQLPDMNWLGIAGYVTKPIRQRHLFHAVGQALGAPSPAGLRTPDSENVRTAKPIPAAPTDSSAGVPSAAPSARRYRILLAEDNDVNQTVAKALIEDTGWACTVVADGQRAIDALARETFDLILMDCHMPVLDGFEATRLIRQSERAATTEGSAGRHIPIVALTANVSAEERQHCIDVGMDGFCPKPFSASQLIAAIGAPLANAAPVTGPEVTESPSSTNHQQPSMAGQTQTVPAPGTGVTPANGPMDMAAVLRRCMGKPALVQTVLHKFEQQAAQAVIELQQGLSETDLAQVAQAAHKLKGMAGTMAADSLRGAAAALETAGRSGDWQLAQDEFKRLKEEIDRCVMFAAQTRKRPSAAEISKSS